MKYISILFFIVALFSLSYGVLINVETKPVEMPVISVLSENQDIFEKMNARFEKLTTDTNMTISFGKSHASEEVMIALMDRQQSALRSGLAALKAQINESEIEVRRLIQGQVERMADERSKDNGPFVIALLSLFVAIISMLPSWIQLIRNEHS